MIAGPLTPPYSPLSYKPCCRCIERTCGVLCVQWMYIVPALIFVMMSQSLSQNAAGQGAE